jgi:mannosyltransferase
LAQAIEPLMRDPAAAEAMGARGRARVLDKFSVEAEAKAINEVYKTLL